MYSLIILLSVSVLIGIGVWGYAYRLGLRHGRAMSVPFRLIDELLDHKIHCCEQDPATARVELESALGIEDWESQSLLQHVLHPSRRSRQASGELEQAVENRTKEVA